MKQVLVDREEIEAVRNTLKNGGGAVGVLRWAESILAQPAEAEGSLAERMRAAGMMTIEEMMAGAPLDRFIKHAGVNDLETYGQWLEMKCREFLLMQASRDLDKREDDDLYEWVLAHAAAFQEARINFKEARDSHLAALSAVTAQRDRLEQALGDKALCAAYAERQKLRGEVERLQAMTAVTCGVGDGSGKLFVHGDYDSIKRVQTLIFEVEALRKAAEPLEPVHGDQLPPIGSRVLIHLSRSDAWVEHTVVGYYVWGDLEGDEYLHRVFVRVRDSDGYLNARLLKDVRPVDAAMAAKEG